jgi:hypothetical protein
MYKREREQRVNFHQPFHQPFNQRQSYPAVWTGDTSWGVDDEAGQRLLGNEGVTVKRGGWWSRLLAKE